jgi:hypothetical protein
MMIAQIAPGLLAAGLPYIHLWSGGPPLFARLIIAVGASNQMPALSRAAFNWRGNDWLRGAGSEFRTNYDEEAAYRIRFNVGVARVATRLLELAPRAVPEIVLFPCPPHRRITDIVRVAAATQPGTVRRLALYDFVESESDQAEAMEIWKFACMTWGSSSLRHLFIEILFPDEEWLRELCVAAACCPRLEVLRIPRIVLPPSFVASMVPYFAPYAATLRSLELSHGPDTAAEVAFIATQLPSLRCLILAAGKEDMGRIPSAAWRCGLRQLLQQLHKLYIDSLSRPLCHALNTLHAFTTADAQRDIATAGFLSDPDVADNSDDDVAPFSLTLDSTTTSHGTPTEEIPLQIFSIYGFGLSRQYSIAPFMRYLSRHAPCLTEVGLSRSTADTAAELITMRGPCRAVDLRDVRGLTDTIVASILKRHRATLRHIVIETSAEPRLTFDPRAYVGVLGDTETPQGAPFTKLATVNLYQPEWSSEQRAYFSYLFPGLCDPNLRSTSAAFLCPW